MDAALVSALSAPVVSAAVLAEFLLTSGTIRLTSADANLEGPAGVTWLGLGRLGSIETVAQPSGASSSPVTLALSGVDDVLLAAMLASETEMAGRFVRIYVGIFDPDSRAYVGRVALFVGRISTVVYSDAPQIGEAGGVVARRHRIEVTVESIFADHRSRSPTLLYTDRQQRAWRAGDEGFAHVPRAAGKQVIWPLM